MHERGAAAPPRRQPGGAPVDIAIAGASRSGSTILALMLGRHPDVAVLGETNRIAGEWDRAPVAMCSCGVPMQACSHWVELAAATDLTTLTTRRGGERHREQVRGLTGARVTVDTSKQAQDLEASNDASFVVHLVRDPRGSALSSHRGWANSDTDPGGHPGVLRTVRVGAWWLRENLRAARLRRRRGGILVRYEDFVVDHEEVCRTVLAHVGLAWHPGPWREHHLATGNPVRLRSEPTMLADLAWRERLPRRLQLACWLAALPLSAVYRYPPVPVRRR